MRFYRKIDFQNFMGDDRHSPNFDFVMIYVYLPLFVCNMSKVRFVCSVQSPKYIHICKYNARTFRVQLDCLFLKIKTVIVVYIIIVIIPMS